MGAGPRSSRGGSRGRDADIPNATERAQVEGGEKLAAVKGPAVYVANHRSWLDIYALFHLRDAPPLKIVAKSEIFRIPLCGWVARPAR